MVFHRPPLRPIAVFTYAGAVVFFRYFFRSLLFFAPTLPNAQHLEDSTDPLDFCGIVAGLLNASDQRRVFQKLSSSLGFHLLHACVFPLDFFKRFPMSVGECVLCCHVGLLQSCHVALYCEVPGPTWCLVEPLSQGGHPGVQACQKYHLLYISRQHNVQ